jgi:uncharacterized protein
MHSHLTGPDSSPTQNQTRRGYSNKENTLMENRTQDEELKAHLLETNEQFRTLAGQHAQLKRQIEEIESKPHVTPADEIEEQRLKKLKLHAKDEMNQIIARYKHASVT